MIGRWLGPLFEWELKSYSRSTLWRAVTVVSLIYLGWSMRQAVTDIFPKGSVPAVDAYHVSRRFSNNFTEFFLNAMLWGVIWITPILFASILAIDRERKMIDYLFSAGLTGREIIFGRWFPRLFLLIAGVFSTAPILMISQIYGGIESDDTFRAVLIILSTAIALSSVAVFASSLAKSRREAIAAVYAILIVLAATPYSISTIISILEHSQFISSRTAETIEKTAAFVECAVSPFQHLQGFSRKIRGFEHMFGSVAASQSFRLSIFFGGQLFVSLLSLLLALRRFRPDPGGFATKLLGNVRLLQRRKFVAFHNRPIFVKDWHFAPAGPWSKLLRFVLVYGGIIAFYLPIYSPIFRSWNFLWRLFGDWTSADILSYFPNSVFAIFCATILLVLVNSLGSINGELHRDSWVSLLSSTLTAREIVWQKTLASLRPTCDLILIATPIFLYYVLKGNAEPVFILWLLITIPCVTFLVASVGVALSLFCRSTMLAIVIGLISSGLVVLTIFGLQSAMCTVPEMSIVRTLASEEVKRTEFASVTVLSGHLFRVRAGMTPNVMWIYCWLLQLLFGILGAVLLELSISEFGNITQRPERYEMFKFSFWSKADENDATVDPAVNL